MKYTILEMFGAFSKMELMNEFELATLFENFSILKQNPLYNDLLEEYNFEDNGISNELISDIVTAMRNDDVDLINKNTLYFHLNNKLTSEIITNVPNKQICHSFVSDYRNLLIEKENSKQR